jgi:hypothetical protein
VVTLFVVTGPPASGKSTWVKQHAKPGDITIDFDALANTLTPPNGHAHKHPPHVQAVTKAARQAAIDTALRHTDTVDVYVIHSLPGLKTMDAYRRHGAEIITVDPGQAIVMARVKAERPWQMQQAAKEWYTTRQQTSVATQQTSADTARQW